MNRDFETQFLNRPDPAPHAMAIQLWCEYYVACEQYDRRVCSIFKEDGTALPHGGHEYRLIQENAARERKRLQQAAHNHGLSEDEMKSAKHTAGRWSHETRLQYLFDRRNS